MPIFSKKQVIETPKRYGYISVLSSEKIIESKGEVNDKIVRYPKELGVEHPFSFEDMEAVYKKFGLINGGINKIVDNIVGEFTIKAENPNIMKLMMDLVKKNNLTCILRDWIREALMKGNGFIEIDSKTGKIKLLNANNMFVVRDEKGEVTGYNQYIGNKNKFNSKKVISFNVNQIAHLPINVVGDDAYGQGILAPNERVVENLILLDHF